LPLTVGRFGRLGSEDPDRPRFTLSVLDHLDQFRKSVIRSCIGIAIGLVGAFTYINPIVEFVFKPIRGVLPEGSRMIYTVPGEAFSVYVQIALIAGIVFAAPFIMYQIWRLIAPALYQHQKLFALPFIALTTGGFIGGALFNHYIVFRWMIAFFGSCNENGCSGDSVINGGIILIVLGTLGILASIVMLIIRRRGWPIALIALGVVVVGWIAANVIDIPR